MARMAGMNEAAIMVKREIFSRLFHRGSSLRYRGVLVMWDQFVFGG